MKSPYFSLILFLSFIFLSLSINGQAKLSFQGILKKSNGQAVSDDVYAMTFKLYNQETGGTLVWSETQPQVEVTSGIYSVILGTVNPMTGVMFDTPYWLGVTIGGSELTPRFLLTPAPYALSLIGESNLFPSAGEVKADKIAASPLAAFSNNKAINGYSFQPGGDEDGGLFSIEDGRLGLYVNGAIRMDMQTNPVNTIIYGTLITNSHVINGNQTINGNKYMNGDINLNADGRIKYGNFYDWKMVYNSNFDSGNDGWQAFEIGNPWGNSTNSLTASNLVINNPFVTNKVLEVQQKNVNSVLTKLIDLTGKPHTEVKVEFNYFFLGSWDAGMAFAGFKTGIGDATESMTGAWFEEGHGSIGLFRTLTDNTRDVYKLVSMVADNPSNQIRIVVGGDSLADSDDHFAIGSVKVWIR